MNARSYEASPMLEGVSQCIFQLDKAEKAGAADTKIAGTISLEWGRLKGESLAS